MSISLLIYTKGRKQEGFIPRQKKASGDIMEQAHDTSVASVQEPPIRSLSAFCLLAPAFSKN